MNLDQRMNDAMKDFDKLELELYRIYFDWTFPMVQYCLDIMQDETGPEIKSLNNYILHFLLMRWAFGDNTQHLLTNKSRIKQFHTDLIDSEFVYRLDPMMKLIRELIVVCQDEQS